MVKISESRININNEPSLKPNTLINILVKITTWIRSCVNYSSRGHKGKERYANVTSFNKRYDRTDKYGSLFVVPSPGSQVSSVACRFGLDSMANLKCHILLYWHTTETADRTQYKRKADDSGSLK
jgi:hypothetical protein